MTKDPAGTRIITAPLELENSEVDEVNMFRLARHRKADVADFT
jgi:hypothetical protein